MLWMPSHLVPPLSASTEEDGMDGMAWSCVIRKGWVGGVEAGPSASVKSKYNVATLCARLGGVGFLVRS